VPEGLENYELIIAYTYFTITGQALNQLPPGRVSKMRRHQVPGDNFTNILVTKVEQLIFDNFHINSSLFNGTNMLGTKLVT
jgi:hypothetical protein